MSPRPPAPNTPLLKSAEKIKQLEAEIEAWKKLTRYVASRILAPQAVHIADYERRRGHQSDITTTLAAFLKDDDDGLYDPTLILNWLEDELPDPGYEVEQR